MEILTHETAALEKLKHNKFLGLIAPFLIISGIINATLLAIREDFRIVNVHWPVPNILFGLPFKIIRGSVLVLSFHGSELALLDLLPQPIQRIFVKLFSLADFITTNSSFNLERLKKLKINPPLEIIPWGVSIKEEFKSWGPERKNIVLFVGRLVEYKGVEVLIKAFKIVSERFPDYRLVIVGDGPLRESLMNLARKINTEGKVEFKGKLPQEDLERIYEESKIFVLPSIVTSKGETEGLGVVLIEALTRGIPIIGSKVGGIPDIIIDGETGLLFEPWNYQDLAQKITYLIENPEFCRKIVEKGQKLVKEKFSWGKITQNWLEILEKLA